MTDKTVEDVKCIIPPLDLARMKKHKKYNNYSDKKQNAIIKTNKERIKILEKIEEWNKLIENLEISKEEIERYFENKMLYKLILLVENLVNLVNERNKNIKKFAEENSKMSSEINKLRNDNIKISKNLIRQRNLKMFEIKTEEDLSENSMV